MKITKPVGVLFEGADTNLYKVTSECSNSSVEMANRMEALENEAGANIYDMMKYKNVLLTQSSVKNLEKRILNEKN